MKHVFIINPISGKKNVVLSLPPQIEEAAEKLGIEVTIQQTEHKGHGTELAVQWADWAEENQEIVRLYSCGGDGSLNEVVSGVCGRRWVEVACVPCGSGNDFVRNYGEKEDFLDLSALMEGDVESIDMIKSSMGWSASICAAGLDAQVAYGIPKYRRLPFCGGSMAYYLSIIEQLCGKRGKKLRIEVDDEVIEQDCLLMAVCNGSYYGGGFYAAPEASLTDNMLDIVIVKKIGLLKIAKVLSIYKSGKHIQNGKVPDDLADIVQFFRGRSVKLKVLEDKPIIVTLDGECSPQMEFTAEVVPNCINMVVPKKLLKKKKEAVMA